LRHSGSVSEALSILKSQRFDVIISDYSLPDGTAFDILDSAGRTPVILITGAGDEEIAVKAWRRGVYDYLVKDLEQNYLKTVPITIENAVRHRQTEERARLLSGAVMSTSDSVFIADTVGKIIFVNRAFCETYGYEEDEVIGRDNSVVCQDSQPDGDMWSTYRDLEVPAWGVYHRRKDGTEFPVSLSVSPIEDENGNEIAYVAVARDISEQLIAEDKLRAINLKLQLGSRAVGQL
jgi:PAS domain S-box-containing protein